MKIPGIAYIVIGVFIAAVAGYVYKFIPKPDGTPNMSMSLFFFIGVIFIIVGFIKLFFKKMEDEKEMEYHKAKDVLEKKTQQVKHKQQTPEQTNHRNRIEEQLNAAVQQQNQQSNQQHTQTTHHAQHTSGYAKTHPYHGIQQNTPDQTTHHAPHTSSLSIIVCRRCGDKNPSTTSYCHGCGYRLR